MSEREATERSGVGAADRRAEAQARLADLANQLGAESRKVLDEGTVDAVPEPVVQELLTVAARLYVAKREQGSQVLPFDNGELTATEVVVTTTNMLKAANLEVFELTMWNGFGTM